MEKTIKIPTMVHAELKVFCALKNESMIDFAGMAIMRVLKDRGHKFLYTKKQRK